MTPFTLAFLRGTEVRILTRSSVWQRSVQITLSVPAQAILYIALWALVIWLVYFSTYPAVHNATHSLRHHTLEVSCH